MSVTLEARHLQAIEDALWAAWTASGRQAPGATFWHRAIADRARRYTSDRDQLAAPADPLADLAARALFYTVADAAKVVRPLDDLARAGWRPGGPLRVVDVGAGCGAMTLGAIAVWADQGVRAGSVRLYDRDGAALDLAQRAIVGLARALGVTWQVDLEVADLATVGWPASDVVLAGTVLNELPSVDAARVAMALRPGPGRSHATVVVEPALRTTTRALHALRDQWAVDPAVRITGPCTHAAPCPMLARDDAWCHAHDGLHLPTRAAAAAQVTGLRDDGARFAYVAMIDATGAPAGPEVALRVVGAPHRSKGKLELPVCGPAGLSTLRVLGRDRSAHRSLWEVARGDRLQVEAGDVPAGPVRLEAPLSVRVEPPTSD